MPYLLLKRMVHLLLFLAQYYDKEDHDKIAKYKDAYLGTVKPGAGGEERSHGLATRLIARWRGKDLRLLYLSFPIFRRSSTGRKEPTGGPLQKRRPWLHPTRRHSRRPSRLQRTPRTWFGKLFLSRPGKDMSTIFFFIFRSASRSLNAICSQPRPGLLSSPTHGSRLSITLLELRVRIKGRESKCSRFLSLIFWFFL